MLKPFLDSDFHQNDNIKDKKTQFILFKNYT